MGKAAVPMANVGRGGVRRPTGSRRLFALVGTQALLVGGGRGGGAWAADPPHNLHPRPRAFSAARPATHRLFSAS